MPPKKGAMPAKAPSGAAKPATGRHTSIGSKGTATGGKGATTSSKGTAAGSKGGATSKAPEAKAPAEEVKPAAAKKVMVPEEIGLKELANVCLNMTGAVGQKVKDSNRWMYVIDRNGNVGNFLKYRDTNIISVTSPTDFINEPMRLALMGALKYGKPFIIDISGSDQTKIFDVIRSKYDEIFPGLYDAILDRSILDEKVYEKLYVPATDDPNYKNPYDYRVADFQFMILTNVDPPSTAMENFFPIIVV